MREFTRKQIMEMLDISYSTIRKYQRELQEFFEAAPGKRSPGVPNTYNETDAKTFATIHHLRQLGVTYDAMRQGELQHALQHGTVEFEPETLDERDEDEQAQGGAVVPLEQFMQLVGKMQATSDELERVLQERDALQERLLDAEKRAVRGEDSERLRAERDELRRLLDAEKSKTWWDKMRGK